jgi:hypothetical protein
MWFVHRYVSHEIHPGLTKLGKAGKVSERTVTRILAEFREAGFITPVKNAKGGSGSTRYTVDMDRISETLEPCAVVTIHGDLVYRDDISYPADQQTEYDEDGLPVVDAAEMAVSDVDLGAGEIVRQPFDFSQFFQNLTLDKMSTGNIGRTVPLQATPCDVQSHSHASAFVPTRNSHQAGKYLGIATSLTTENADA